MSGRRGTYTLISIDGRDLVPNNPWHLVRMTRLGGSNIREPTPTQLLIPPELNVCSWSSTPNLKIWTTYEPIASSSGPFQSCQFAHFLESFTELALN